MSREKYSGWRYTLEVVGHKETGKGNKLPKQRKMKSKCYRERGTEKNQVDLSPKFQKGSEFKHGKD